MNRLRQLSSNIASRSSSLRDNDNDNNNNDNSGVPSLRRVAVRKSSNSRYASSSRSSMSTNKRRKRRQKRFNRPNVDVERAKQE